MKTLFISSILIIGVASVAALNYNGDQKRIAKFQNQVNLISNIQDTVPKDTLRRRKMGDTSSYNKRKKGDHTFDTMVYNKNRRDTSLNSTPDSAK